MGWQDGVLFLHYVVFFIERELIAVQHVAAADH